MKKVLSFIILMVCAVTGAWAATTVSLSDGTLTITTTAPGTLSSYSFNADQKAATTIVLSGKFNSADLTAINANNGFTSVKTVNMKGAEFPKQSNNNVQYYMYNSQPNNGNQGSLYVIGGDNYKSAPSDHVVEEVSSDASNSWREAQGDWWDYQHEEKLANSNNEYYKFRKDKYYHKVEGEWISIEKSEIPENSTIDYQSNYNDTQLSNINTDKEYICVHSSSEYNYYYAYQKYNWVKQDSYNDNTQVNQHYASIDDAPAATSEYQYNNGIAVGGTVKVYNNGSWENYTEDSNDWTQMAFGGWNGLETIILPDNFNVESGKNYNNFYGNNKSTLQRIERGDSYAIIESSNNNYTAEIFCADDDRANMKAIVGLDNFVTQDANITYANPNDHDYITWNETTQVYDVHVTSAGSLASKFQKLYNTVGANNLEGKVFRFDSECTGFTAEDLQALAHANGPFVYVDLYNVAATEAVETAISDALKGNDSGCHGSC